MSDLFEIAKEEIGSNVIDDFDSENFEIKIIKKENFTVTHKYETRDIIAKISNDNEEIFVAQREVRCGSYFSSYECEIEPIRLVEQYKVIVTKWRDI